MIVNTSITIVDLAFNLSGSLAGIPAVLSQLPVGKRIGFASLPAPWEDTYEAGQTWTPSLDGLDLAIEVEVYNPIAMQKAPYTTDFVVLNESTAWGTQFLSDHSDLLY